MENLPPGFRFFPTEEELVSFYLHNKLDGTSESLSRAIHRVIPVLDICDFNPWDLPQFSGDLCYGDPEEWFFFVPRQESEARGGRPKRLTTCGYWKATGSPRYVYSSGADRKIGFKRTMVFYKGRAPNGRKTEWKMNEYKLTMELAGEAPSSSSGALPAEALREEFSLCRVHKKSKCLRQYDRRPVGVEITHTTRSTSHDHHENPGPTVERTILQPETESSYKCQYPTQTGEIGGTAMGTTTDPLWDMDFDFDGEDMDLN